MADDLILTVGGQRFTGWTEIAVSRSLETLAGTFEVQLSQQDASGAVAAAIEAGAACQVAIGDDTLLTGYVDSLDASVDAGAHSISIRGRDKTGDLMDCSAIHKPGSWKGRKLEQIAADLAKPLGITVKAVADTGVAFDRFALQQGESVFEAISRMAKLRAVLPVTNEKGELELRRPGQNKAAYRLELGVNILSARRRNHVEERFSDYIVKGHAAGDDFLGGGAASRPKAEAKDPGVARYRPLLIVNDGAGAAASLKDRAKWEATTRAGRAEGEEIRVQGWRSEGGDLYRIDQLVPVKAALLGVDEELLVSAVAFRLSKRGRTTDLTLTRKEAFSLLALAPKKPKKGRHS